MPLAQISKARFGIGTTEIFRRQSRSALSFSAAIKIGIGTRFETFKSSGNDNIFWQLLLFSIYVRFDDF